MPSVGLKASARTLMTGRGMTHPDHIPHGSPDMLFEEIEAVANGAAFHAQMAAQYASARNAAGTLYALRCLIACAKAAGATGKDLNSMKQAEEFA
jgi:hypothetical protein